ncbi:N-alpha-acetyltransferase 38-B- NatC auxiliary subunit [Apiospora arundinis]|uniref:Sm domain-containing protein n=1 Tax=Apiospora arundinis TaxID=335852 RepID=A0ABR2HS84_9PEZI
MEATKATEAESYLNSLINKTLRVHATDSRMFVGTFKCTDANRNVVLSLCHEYRQPSQKQLEAAAASSSTGTVQAEMTSRYLGLVVIPGKHIVKMEAEEFVSQMKGKSALGDRALYV